MPSRLFVPGHRRLCDGKNSGWFLAGHFIRYTAAGASRRKQGSCAGVEVGKAGQEQEQIHIPVETGRLPS